MLPLDLGQGVPVQSVSVGPKRVRMRSSVWFVMFPFLSLLSADPWKQHRDLSSPIDMAVSKNSLYTRTTNYIEGESPHLPKDLDHSLGIAREEVPHKCLFFCLFFYPPCETQINFFFQFSVLVFLTVFSPLSDRLKGEGSTGVEEEV